MNLRSKLNVAAATVVTFIATNSYAGQIADAVTTATADFKADLASTGGIAIGVGLVGVGFIAAVKLLRRAI